MITNFNFILLWCLTSACGQGTSPAEDGGDRRRVLASLATNVFQPSLGEFESALLTLETSLSDYCGGSAIASEVQSSWNAAMLSWQRLEAMQVGPLAEDGGALRDQVYSWPLGVGTAANECSVDIEVARYAQDPNVSLKEKLVDRRGLDALGYLLYAEGTSGVCDSEPSGWSALSEVDRLAARCGYASLVVEDLVATHTTLRERWDGNGGFEQQLVAAGTPESEFGSAQTALNWVSNAMFYLDTEVKDMKVGRPSGVQENQCGVAVVCLEVLEFDAVELNNETLVANLEGFAGLYYGTLSDDGYGFDDYLVALGAERTAADMSAAVDNAVDSARQLSAPMRELLLSNPEEVVALYNSVKGITDIFKSEFFTVTGLDLPDMGAGDND